jgi:hypothetical protein
LHELFNQADAIIRSLAFKPIAILCCDFAAMQRHLDLDVAAADAKYWWEKSLVPLRATPRK